ncbi:MAG: hypothetical protein WBP12_05850 [Candidatus Saccharimonas sp.]
MDKNPRPDRRKAFAKEQAELREKRILDELEKELDVPTDNQILDTLDTTGVGDDHQKLFAVLEQELTPDIDLDTLQMVMYERAIELEQSGATPEWQAIEVIDIPFGMFGDGLLTSELVAHSNGYASGHIAFSNDASEKPMRLRRNPEEEYWEGYDILINDKQVKPSDTAIAEFLAMNMPANTEMSSAGLQAIIDMPSDNVIQDLVTVYKETFAPHSNTYVTTSAYAQYIFSSDNPSAGEKPTKKISLTISNARFSADHRERAIELEYSLYKESLGEGTRVVTIKAHLDTTGNIALEARMSSPDVQGHSVKIPLRDESTILIEMISALNALVNNNVT